MKPIHLILSIALLAGGACGDQQEPYYGNSEVKMPQIDSEWNLELMPNRSGQYWKVFVYKDLKYNALFTRSLGWNGGDGVFTTGLPDGNIFWSFNDSFYGVINENRSRGNCSFPRNSIMVQTPGEKDENLVWLADYVQTNDPNADRYYQAANAALNSFTKVLLANHIKTCVTNDILAGKEETVDELVAMLQKLMK